MRVERERRREGANKCRLELMGLTIKMFALSVFCAACVAYEAERSDIEATALAMASASCNISALRQSPKWKSKVERGDNTCCICTDDILRSSHLNGGSSVEGTVLAVNSSVALVAAELRQLLRFPAVAVDRQSAACVVCRRIVTEEKQGSPISMCGGCVFLRNVSLRMCSAAQTVPSLVSVAAGVHGAPFSEQLSVLSCVFASFAVAVPPLLPCASQHISSAMFANITHADGQSSQLQRSTRKRAWEAEIVSSEMRNCANPYSGVVVVPPDVWSMHVNSTFADCRATTGRQEFVDGTHEASDCVFSVVTNESGGAFCCKEKASLSVVRCSFVNCSAYQGGAIYFEHSSGFFLCERCVVDGCSAKGETGGIFLRGCSSSVVKGTVIGNCVASGKALFMYANLASGVHVMDSNILENGKTVDHYAGALHLYYVLDELTISNTLFHSNHAKTFAGCILFGATSGPKSAKYQLSFCFFRNNTATQLGGNDIHISNNNCYENLTDRNLTGCYSLTEGVRVSKCTSGGYDCSENQTYTNWLPDIPSAYETSVDSRSGMDRGDCGYAPLCQTIHFAFGRIEARSSNKIGVKAGKCVEEETEVSSRSVVVEGEQREGCQIESDGSGGCVFGITTGHFVGRSVTLVHKNSESGGGGVFLAMTDNGIVDLVGCNVEGAAGEEALQAPFMTMSRGMAMLEDVKMEGMRFGGRGAIQGSAPGSGCGIVVKESNMSGIEVSEGNGSVVCFALGGGGEVVVSSCKVSGCGCESGCGGSVCVKMEGGGRVVVNGTERTQFELCMAGAGRDGAGGLGGAVFVETNSGGGEMWMGNTTFERCTAKKGAKVFVSSSDLSSVIVRERFLVEHTAEDAEALSGFDRDWSGEAGYVPLIVFVEQWGGRAFVAGEEGAEHYRCGFSFYACSTIEKAVEHRFASGKRRMVLEAPFVFDHEMVFSGEEYEMEGRQAQNEIRIDGASGASGAGQSGLLCVQTGVAVSDVVFVLPMSIGGRNAFVRCESHELRLVRCTLRPVGSLSSSPSFAAGVAAGTLSREEQRKMTYSFVCVVDSALRVESLVVDRGMCLQRSSVIGCSGVCDVELRGCVFEGVEKTEGSGACVEGEVRGVGTKREGRIVVEGCTFRRCKAAEQESSGGGVCAALWGKSMLVVNGTGVFEECKASEGSSGKGRGGGVMIRVNDEESRFGICGGVVFSREKPNWARWGRDVFVDCGSGVLLEGKISAESVGFADPLEMADDGLGVCGVENGSAVPVIPLFVYLLVQPGRIRVDGRSGADHAFCGFELFECLTVDYCFEERSSVNASRIEVCSEARLGAEMKVESFGLTICSQSEAEARVDVEDEGTRSEEGLISCSFPFSASGTLFWLARRLQVGREWLILSRESLRLSKCRVGSGFEDGESAGFGAICVVGGRMELRECAECGGGAGEEGSGGCEGLQHCECGRMCV
ncbi:uncharacterized protein MONOS_12969 [Monocercomonoides exilis]|uniref:uncharacterized protein n=1 Tax=Monocercomonoides exilis TaxID=2049356 RepID=UPI00355A406C|nr:hypothetical protein MONOS_12969 [Monocercomonoides exilis]|eukprot:MONOS_12969.1-p1 / transcript=MONOS_12969.1 / gene=MONOS_12969 / organism=Monocercomonoides_exilis_PA203 / gene_product=unspecified product / transcript_product=unspecified product / location=Mono_scaffold00761:2338-6669(+) / protein_length=1444 / sequence_SO=supercontig / SO=protein_coding / is_pseudo=false